MKKIVLTPEEEELLEEWLSLPWKEQKAVFWLWFKDLSKKQQAYVCAVLRQSLDFRQAPKVERWMERRWEKDFSLPPKRVASECRRYLGIRKEMLPWLIKTAQRVKKRLWMRYHRMGWVIPAPPPRRRRRKEAAPLPAPFRRKVAE
ncbi:hypothetical protein D6833_07360 [Candidatus Parcubacteria bacterium]|nr:MAG: hypothetical protein D6833_07360 [Candidatus Parcubacteria bacterium]